MVEARAKWKRLVLGIRMVFTYTIQTLIDKNGKIIDQHVRPGGPKYGDSNIMTRAYFLRRFVLNEVSDDHESLEKIVAEVERVCREIQIAISRSDVERSLATLIADGLIEMRALSAGQGAVGAKDPQAEQPWSGEYLIATSARLVLHLTGDDW